MNYLLCQRHSIVEDPCCGGVSNPDMREIAQKSGLETPPTIGIILKWTSTVAILTPLNWKNRQLNASVCYVLHRA